MGLFNLKAGKNKPIVFIAKTRDFARICEGTEEKRGFVMNPRFGRSEILRMFGVRGRRIANKTWHAEHTSRIGTRAKKRVV